MSSDRAISRPVFTQKFNSAKSPAMACLCHKMQSETNKPIRPLKFPIGAASCPFLLTLQKRLDRALVLAYLIEYVSPVVQESCNRLEDTIRIDLIVAVSRFANCC
ncbi:hypothetical protein CEXT_155301 [Caerostris extrusa]|uniref:Uncharacterized protein n=1 Tax=Caerostris extrusa TaxID=172846 RepID=A0AAV4SG21_CAEEX|nr:hypothetical protein CEXT_155301 [Caerostris extrusa]